MVVPPIRRLDAGTPIGRLDRGTPLVGSLDGSNPPPHQEIEQQSEHLLCGGQYASCVHAGRLSFLSSNVIFIFNLEIVSHKIIIYHMKFADSSECYLWKTMLYLVRL